VAGVDDHGVVRAGILQSPVHGRLAATPLSRAVRDAAELVTMAVP
jgi:hypothetical protein